jgi:hypothetical protein
MSIISHIFPHPNKQQLHETEAQQQQYIESTRTTLKKDPTIKNTKSKTLRMRTNLRKSKHGHIVLDAVHDYSALKFCKAISSTYDENSTYQNIITQQEEKKEF